MRRRHMIGDVLMDSSGTERFANDAMAGWLRKKSDETIGMQIEDLKTTGTISREV